MELSTGLHPGNVYLEASPLNIDFACVKTCIFTHIRCAWPQTWLSSFQLLITSSLYHTSTFWRVGCIWIGRWTRSILSLSHFGHPCNSCESNFVLTHMMDTCHPYVLTQHTVVAAWFVVDVHQWLIPQPTPRSIYLLIFNFFALSFSINSRTFECICWTNKLKCIPKLNSLLLL